MKMEQEKKKPREEIYAEFMEKQQTKILKPLLKQEKVLKKHIELIDAHTWDTKLPDDTEEIYKENGYDRYRSILVLESELKAIKEMIRRIEGKPKQYDERPEQQLYHELYNCIGDIIDREAGKHDFRDNPNNTHGYESKVGYINTSGEVEGRVARTMPTGWGEHWHISDVCSKIVDKIKEIKAEYPKFYGEEIPK